MDAETEEKKSYRIGGQGSHRSLNQSKACSSNYGPIVAQGDLSDNEVSNTTLVERTTLERIKFRND